MARYVILKDKNLKPENIKSGVKIFKVEGTYEGGGGGEGEWDWVVQAKRHEIDDVTDKSLEELAQLEWGACGILSGTEITELPEIDFSDPIATHGLAYSLAGTSVSDVEIPATTNALNAHSCFEGMFFDCNDLEHVAFTDFDVTPYTDGEMSEHFERAFMNAGGNVSPIIEWVDDGDHNLGGVMDPGLYIEFRNLTYANSNMFNEAFRGIKGADASYGILGVEFPVLEKIGGTYTPSDNEAKGGAKAPLPSNNGVKCFYNAFHSSRLYYDSEGNQTGEWELQHGTMQNIFPALTEIHGNGVFAHAFSRSNLCEFNFPNELTLYLAGESETEGMFECVCRDCKDLRSITLSAKYDPDTVDRNTKVWRDAFDGCDNLIDAYVSDTLVAYPDERNILESAVNVDYIELNMLPDFDWESGDPYPGHDMYFTWQPALLLDSIRNILDFAWNEFGDAEDNPHEIWFYENTIIEDNEEYNPEDPEIMQMVDEIMEYKADLESYGWTIHNLYRSASDVPGGGYIDCDYIALSIEEEEPLENISDAKRGGVTKAGGNSGAKSPYDPEAENYCLTNIGLNDNFAPDHIDWLFTCPDSETDSYFVFGAMENYFSPDNTRIWGVFNDLSEIYICLGTTLDYSLCIPSSDGDFANCMHIVGDFDYDNDEWNLTINGEQYTAGGRGGWFEFYKMGILGAYNTTSDKVVFGLPSDVNDIKIGHLRFSDDSGDVWLNYEPCSGIHMDEFGDITRADAFIKATCSWDDTQFYGFTLAEGASAEPRDFNIDFDSTYEVQGGVEMLPVFDSSGVPAFVESSGGGSDWLADALAGNITDLSGYSLPGLPADTSNANAYQYLFYQNDAIESTPDIIGDIAFLDNYKHAAQYMFSECHSLKTANLNSLTKALSYNTFLRGFYDCTSLESLSMANLQEVGGNASFQQICMGCTSLKSVNFSSLVKFNAFNGSGMFTNCNALETIYLHPDIFNNAFYNNKIYSNIPTVENLYLSANATKDMELTNLPNLTAASVLEVLTHLDLTVSGKSVNFYSSGLTVTDDAQGSIQDAYDAAVDAGWTINNLTITPDPGL